MRVGLMTQGSCFTLEPLVVKKVFHIVKQPMVLQKQLCMALAGLIPIRMNIA